MPARWTVSYKVSNCGEEPHDETGVVELEVEGGLIPAYFAAIVVLKHDEDFKGHPEDITITGITPAPPAAPSIH